MIKRARIARTVIIGILLVPVLLFAMLTSILYWKQDQIVRELIETVNKDFRGGLRVEDSHISPFANFPYISIDLDHVTVYEDKGT